MKKQIGKYWIFLFGLILIPLLFRQSTDNNVKPLGSAALPKDAVLLLHTGTWTLSGSAQPFPREKMYFYNADGEILSTTLDMEEFLGRGIYGDQSLCYFINNHAVLMDRHRAKSYTDYDPSTQISVGATSSESGSGYIEEMDTYYALQNIGRRVSGGPYISALRFVSFEHSYDVIIPYYVTDLCYDPLKRQFICILSDLTRPPEGYPGYEHNLDGENNEGLAYLAISFDFASNRFFLQDSVTVLPAPPNPALLRDSYKLGFLYKNGFLYQVSQRYHASYEEGDQYLVLSTYDLTNGRYVSSIDLLPQYDPESSEYTWAVGGCIGANRPVVRNGSLYIFVSPSLIFKVSDETHIETFEMPYPFENVVNIMIAPLTNLEDTTPPLPDFSGTFLHITQDNDIYVLLLFQDGNLRLFKLLPDGNYQLCWQAPLPSDLNYDVHICDFVLLHDFE